MRDTSICSTLNLQPRFQRSTELSQDFYDPKALEGYCLTDFAVGCLKRIAAGFTLDSSQRTWRLTGDYGSGKSSFALLFAQAAGEEKLLPRDIKRSIKEFAPELLKTRNVPLLVVGSRMPLGLAILRRLEVAFNELYTRGAKSALHVEIENACAGKRPPADDEVIRLLKAANEKIVVSGKGDGVILILDEVGKFLEYAAINPKQQDVMLLQRLAETATRSRRYPFHVVCLLHQGFNAYADQLAQSAAREWEKVAARFEEITFRQPLDEVATLVASSIRTRIDLIPASLKKLAKRSMHEALEMGWYGNSVGKNLMQANALPLFPLDPFLLPVASKITHRYGQNERSLFSFIFNYEPFGLREFAARPLNGADCYRLHNFFDYVRANMGGRLAVTGYRSRWTVIESVVEAHMDNDPLQVEILKTIGLLNLINSDELRPSSEAIAWAVGGGHEAKRQLVLDALGLLSKKTRVYYRGAQRGYCLWPYTSVDIDRAMDDAKAKIPSVVSIEAALSENLATRPIVARRHYIESGNLRFFNVHYCAPDALAERVGASSEIVADGDIFVPLCEHEEDRQNVFSEIRRLALPKNRIALIAVPRPLAKLRPFILEAQRWAWIIENTPDLKNDSYARQEVEVQRQNAERLLDAKLQEFVGLNRMSSTTTLTWFIGGQEEKNIHTGRDLLKKLSDICDDIFGEKAPRLKNELLNRHYLSSAAAAARMRLLERIVLHPNAVDFGMEPTKKPPEKSMYLSALKASNIHVEVDGTWTLAIPEAGKETDPCNVRPALEYIREKLYGNPDSRIPIQQIYTELSAQPFGIRLGVLPLFLAIVTAIHQHEIAYYETGTFVAEVNGDMFRRLAKAPERFDVQFCRVEGVRADLFKTICDALAYSADATEPAKLLSVVQPLCRFAAGLSEYVRKTKTLSQHATAVRDALMDAREPVRLIFHDLPIACGLEPFAPGEHADTTRIDSFVTTLKASIDELKLSLPALRARLADRLQTLFQLTGPFKQWRCQLAERAAGLLADVREPKLNAFCFRLIDESLGETESIDSIASYVANKVPERWADRDEDIFDIELNQLVTRFQRVESIIRQRKGSVSSNGYMRLAVTRLDGQEVERVFQTHPDQAIEIADMRREIAEVLNRNKRIGLLAAAEEFMAMLSEESPS